LADKLIVVEMAGDHPAWREVSQPRPGVLSITSSGTGEDDDAWSRRVLSCDVEPPTVSDPTIRQLAQTFPGLRPYSDGSLFDGLLTAIIGQSVSLASAAAAQFKLAAAFNSGIDLHGRLFYPLPTASQLVDARVELIRESGVTWKRAEGIRFAAQEQIAGNLPTDEEGRSAPEDTIRALMKLPMVGRWTAESVLLWGIGAPDAHPTNDIALLNAARLAYERPEMTFRELDALSDGWRPARSIAARLLWTQLLGLPPTLKA
jgi:3-methyladenine DNA glycosylase/8-oxoguanine DNA glycosylase